MGTISSALKEKEDYSPMRKWNKAFDQKFYAIPKPE
jgi:hypothetical protein